MGGAPSSASLAHLPRELKNKSQPLISELALLSGGVEEWLEWENFGNSAEIAVRTIRAIYGKIWVKFILSRDFGVKRGALDGLMWEPMLSSDCMCNAWNLALLFTPSLSGAFPIWSTKSASQQASCLSSLKQTMKFTNWKFLIYVVVSPRGEAGNKVVSSFGSISSMKGQAMKKLAILPRIGRQSFYVLMKIMIYKSFITRSTLEGSGLVPVTRW